MFSQVSVFSQGGYLWSLVPSPFWGLGIQEVGMSRGWVCPRGVGMSRGVGTHPSDTWDLGILQHTVDKRAVRIFLKCFLV